MKKRCFLFALLALLLCACTSKPPEEPPDAAPEEPVRIEVRVGALKGPTSMGLMALTDQGGGNSYDFTMVTAADELLGLLATDKVDIALLPANAAANLYQKLDHDLAVIDINTLGVLYVVTADETVTDLASLSGRTVLLTGKGTTPDYALQYLLSAYGVEDVTLEYKSEAAEVAAALAADPAAVGLLPQPFATAAQVQNTALRQAVDLTAQWDALDNGSRLVTGVTVFRRSYLKAWPEVVDSFLADHAASVAYAQEHPTETAALIEQAGIVAKAAIAEKALPYCSLTCLTGEEMKTALSGYLAVLHGQDPRSVGGELPGEDFYYLP